MCCIMCSVAVLPCQLVCNWLSSLPNFHAMMVDVFSESCSSAHFHPSHPSLPACISNPVLSSLTDLPPSPLPLSSYIQQLREGVNNFFATFIEVLRDRNEGRDWELEPGITCGDFLFGMLQVRAPAGEGREGGEEDAWCCRSGRGRGGRQGGCVVLHRMGCPAWCAALSLCACAPPRSMAVHWWE